MMDGKEGRMMDDLISRAAAIEYLMTNMGWQDENGYAVEDADEKRAIITDLVNGIPAVEAVPVVRCKDCICYDDEPGGTLKMCYRGLGWTSPDDYCSKGARAKKMDGEANG